MHFTERAPPLPGWPELAELLNMSTLWSAETFAVLRDGLRLVESLQRSIVALVQPPAAFDRSVDDSGAVTDCVGKRLPNGGVVVVHRGGSGRIASA